MVTRPFWISKLEKALARRPIVWLSGVRRSGKTFLCNSLAKKEYFDCEIPSVRRDLEDVETFLKDRKGLIILDEIHRLSNPAEILKIAADHVPHVRIIATGSSSLQASRKFRDTLTGRKEEVHLTPLISDDLTAFGNTDITHRFINGGLPPFFMNPSLPENDFQEWIDSYWAKDILELFRLERRHSFQKFIELLFVNSGGIFEASGYAKPCEISRASVANYLAVLEATSTVHILRPFSSRSSSEIIAAPKVYAFDTGFICYFRGWNSLREEYRGGMWEHYILNELTARTGRSQLFYWRDKRGHEIDFVRIPARSAPPVAIECKWSPDHFDPLNINIFRRRYPAGENWVVCRNLPHPFEKRVNDIVIQFLDLDHLIRKIVEPHSPP